MLQPCLKHKALSNSKQLKPPCKQKKDHLQSTPKRLGKLLVISLGVDYLSPILYSLNHLKSQFKSVPQEYHSGLLIVNLNQHWRVKDRVDSHEFLNPGHDGLFGSGGNRWPRP